jgi:hypothetical protein
VPGAYGGLDHHTRSGAYTGDGASHHLVLKSYSRETAEFRGYLDFDATNKWYVIRDLYLHGRYVTPGQALNNPNMKSIYHVAGSDVLITNNEIDGGKDDPSIVSGSQPYNKRQTCMGYTDNPIRSVISKNWFHNCRVNPQHSADGDDGSHCRTPLMPVTVARSPTTSFGSAARAR